MYPNKNSNLKPKPIQNNSDFENCRSQIGHAIPGTLLLTWFTFNPSMDKQVISSEKHPGNALPELPEQK